MSSAASAIATEIVHVDPAADGEDRRSDEDRRGQRGLAEHRPEVVREEDEEDRAEREDEHAGLDRVLVVDVEVDDVLHRSSGVRRLAADDEARR